MTWQPSEPAGCKHYRLPVLMDAKSTSEWHLEWHPKPKPNLDGSSACASKVVVERQYYKGTASEWQTR